MDKIFLTVGDVAKLCKCSVSTVIRAADAGGICAILIGKKRGPRGGGCERLFLPMEVDRFLAERRKARGARGKRKKAGDQP